MTGPTLLLVGLGHSHLFVLEALARGEIRGARAVLLTPPGYDYSGMIPGEVARSYPHGASSLDPASLARAAGADWVPERAVRIDPRGADLEGGGRIDADLLSIGIGSVPVGHDLPGVREHATLAKPIDRVRGFAERAERLAAEARAGRPARLVLVGGGAAGTEVALCLSADLRRRHPGRWSLTVVERGGALLESFPERTREVAAGVLRERGVTIRTNAAVAGVGAAGVTLESGEVIPADAVLWATGPAAPPLLRRSALPVDEGGWLRVLPTLQAEGEPRLFGAGDCVSLRGYPLVARAGVYAVREGPLLARNLDRVLQGADPEPYEPQRDWLSLMNTGDGRALLSWHGVTLHNHAAWWLKDRIDRRFVERFRQR